MKRVVRIAGLAALFTSSAAPLLAQTYWGGTCWYRCTPRPVSVPEIDASAGALAIAAAAAALMYIRERRKSA